MEKQIIEDIDVLVDDLKDIQSAIREGKNLERIDALDTLSFITVGIGSIYNKIKEQFHLQDEE